MCELTTAQNDQQEKEQLFQNIQELLNGQNIIFECFERLDELLLYYINLYEISTENILEKIGLNYADEQVKLSGIKEYYKRNPAEKPKEYIALEKLRDKETLYMFIEASENVSFATEEKEALLLAKQMKRS